MSIVFAERLRLWRKSEESMLSVTRFSHFTDEELDAMELAFCNEGLTSLVDEIRREKRYRKSWEGYSDT
jgi:hypothetical protein